VCTLLEFGEVEPTLKDEGLVPPLPISACHVRLNGRGLSASPLLKFEDVKPAIEEEGRIAAIAHPSVSCMPEWEMS